MSPGWLDRLLGRATREPQERATDPGRTAAPSRADPLGGRRVLRPIDAPAIRARIRKLGIVEGLTPEMQAELDRHVMEACRAGVESLWWEPLRAFVRQVAYNPTVQVPLRVVHGQVDTVEARTEQRVRVEGLLAHRRVQFVEVLSAEGLRLDPGDPVADGDYALRVRSDGQDLSLPFSVVDGLVDLEGLTARLNELLAGRGLPERLLLLPPDGELHALVCCLEPVARQAAEAGWGVVPGLD